MPVIVRPAWELELVTRPVLLLKVADRKPPPLLREPPPDMVESPGELGTMVKFPNELLEDLPLTCKNGDHAISGIVMLSPRPSPRPITAVGAEKYSYL